MNQQEFFEAFKTKKMKEVTITLECDCQVLYSPKTEEVFAKPCLIHDKDV